MPSNAIASRYARVEQLRTARAKDSATKRERTLSVCQNMLDAGLRVSFARVAREARVSTWLVYNVAELRDAIQGAIEAQERDGIAPKNLRGTIRNQSNDSLITDLALSREEAKTLRAEVKKLRGRLELQLGAEAEGSTVTELIRRVQQVEELNRKLHEEIAERDTRILQLIETGQELQAELEGKTEALRRLMFATNTDS